MKLYQIKIPANGFKVFNVKADSIKDAIYQAQDCLQNRKNTDTCVDLKEKPSFEIQITNWDIDILSEDFK